MHQYSCFYNPHHFIKKSGWKPLSLYFDYNVQTTLFNDLDKTQHWRLIYLLLRQRFPGTFFDKRHYFDKMMRIIQTRISIQVINHKILSVVLQGYQQQSIET